VRNKRYIKTAGQEFEPLVWIAVAQSFLDRWSMWSKSIASRRLRTIQTRSTMALTLFERTRAVLNLSQRWIAQPLHLNLGTIVLEDLRSLRQINPGGSSPEPDRILPARVIVDEQRRIPSTSFEPARGRQVELMPLSPLQQVFRRFEQTEAASVSHLTLSVDRAVSLTRRLVEERRRIDLSPRRETFFRGRGTEGGPGKLPEQASSRAVGMHDRDAGRAAMILDRSAKRMAPDEQCAASSAARRGAMDRDLSPVSPPAPPINMEQITEHVIRQIDHRLIAHRERMGRPGV
jgi:hypothetical protein